jgi:hypothetical protein
MYVSYVGDRRCCWIDVPQWKLQGQAVVGDGVGAGTVWIPSFARVGAGAWLRLPSLSQAGRNLWERFYESPDRSSLLALVSNRVKCGWVSDGCGGHQKCMWKLSG